MPAGLADGLEVGVPLFHGRFAGTSRLAASKIRPVARISRRWFPRGAGSGRLRLKSNIRLWYQDSTHLLTAETCLRIRAAAACATDNTRSRSRCVPPEADGSRARS